jgi:demethylmenaquinone methyltransferase/2-methoxy-6-polyprenyl-1,4-benzoquinol methylase
MNDAMSAACTGCGRTVRPPGEAAPGEAILDMAGGTGDIAFRIAERGAEVTVADINQEMLDVGIERAMKRGIDGLVWSRQNAEELAFPTACSTPTRSPSASAT